MTTMRNLPAMLAFVALCIAAEGAAAQATASTRRTLSVTATAYNATPQQTDGRPHVGAWGDRLDNLEPGFRAVAVSPDLVAQGLTRHRRLRIEGFKGEFLVLDRTPSQWQNRIDIFMGADVAAARRFGKKSVKISWTEPAKKAR